MPPSYIRRLWPLRPPLEFQKPVLCPPSLLGPLSLAKRMMVLSSMPNFSTKARIRPTSLSRYSIMAAKPATGLMTSGVCSSLPAPYLPIRWSNWGSFFRHFS